VDAPTRNFTWQHWSSGAVHSKIAGREYCASVRVTVARTSLLLGRADGHSASSASQLPRGGEDAQRSDSGRGSPGAAGGFPACDGAGGRLPASWRSLAWGENSLAPVWGCEVPKLTPAQAAEVAALPSWDEMTEQQRQEADRVHAEVNGFVFCEPRAQERAGQASKRGRSPIAIRSRQARSRRCPRAADGGVDSSDDGGDPEAAAPLRVWTLDGAVSDGQLTLSVQNVRVCAPGPAECEVSPS
jgi:hypothetical protein